MIWSRRRIRTFGSRRRSSANSEWNRSKKSKPASKRPFPGRSFDDHSESRARRISLRCSLDNEHALAVAQFLRDDPGSCDSITAPMSPASIGWMHGDRRKVKVKKLVEGEEKEVEETIEQKHARLSGSGLSSLFDGATSMAR